MRKVIQIVSAGHYNEGLFALCDDGTILYNQYPTWSPTSTKWVTVKDIPQDIDWDSPNAWWKTLGEGFKEPSIFRGGSYFREDSDWNWKNSIPQIF